jgi:hypothetical protein
MISSNLCNNQSSVRLTSKQGLWAIWRQNAAILSRGPWKALLMHQHIRHIDPAFIKIQETVVQRELDGRSPQQPGEALGLRA